MFACMRVKLVAATKDQVAKAAFDELWRHHAFVMHVHVHEQFAADVEDGVGTEQALEAPLRPVPGADVLVELTFVVKAFAAESAHVIPIAFFPCNRHNV